MMKSSPAFTLIELLVTLSIIGVIVTISSFALNEARKSARDSRRKSDLEFIRSGLELYRADCGGYPASLSFGGSLIGTGAAGTACSSSNTYIQKIPTDPHSDRAYSYNQLSARSYVVCASLESPPDPPMSHSGCGSCGGGSCNYYAQSP